MALETGTYISDLVATNPTASDPISQGDDHTRLLKSTLLNTLVGYPGAIAVTGTDGGVVNAYTLTPGAGTLPAYGNRMLAVFAPTITNTGPVTLAIGALAAKNVLSVSGAALTAGDLAAGCVYAAFYNGTEFRLLSITKNYADQLVFAGTLPAQALGLLASSGTVAAFTKSLAFALNEAKAAAVASAATPDIWSGNGNTMHITGTTTITGFAAAPQAGARRRLFFDGAVLLTNSANLVVQGGASFTTAAGDMVDVYADTTTTFYVAPMRADGGSVAPATAAEIKAGSNTAKQISPAQLLAALGVSASFTSADQVITPGGLLTIAHGLGRAPTLVFAFLRNTTAEYGFSVGDVTPTVVAGGIDSNSGYTGVAITFDVNNVYVRYGVPSGGPVFPIANKTTGSGGNATNASWSFFLRVLA